MIRILNLFFFHIINLDFWRLHSFGVEKMIFVVEKMNVGVEKMKFGVEKMIFWGENKFVLLMLFVHTYRLKMGSKAI
jgi:hypothetical protein